MKALDQKEARVISKMHQKSFLKSVAKIYFGIFEIIDQVNGRTPVRTTFETKCVTSPLSFPLSASRPQLFVLPVIGDDNLQDAECSVRIDLEES